MHIRRFALLILPLLSVVVCAAAQREGGPPPADDKYLGLWSGSWEGGGGSGGFDLTLERDKDKNLIGQVSVTGEPTYKATLTSVAFDGAKMTAKYDFTPDPEGEVVLTATFEGNSASGAWSLREKASGNEFASGGWKVAKKDKQLE
jgi:hypothetical protein